MADSAETPRSGERYVTIPARARDEIGELAFYLDQVRQNLLTVHAHVTASSHSMPGVLRDLKEIVRMTESATVSVLEQTEALLEEGQTLSALIGRAQAAASSQLLPPEVAGSLAEVQSLVDRSNDRVLSIMNALEFQDLTSQKIQRAFEILEEVGVRVGKIHGLVSLGEERDGPAPDDAPSNAPAAADDKSAQDLADEILSRFKG